jgi:hypothetical protein
MQPYPISLEEERRRRADRKHALSPLSSRSHKFRTYEGKRQDHHTAVRASSYQEDYVEIAGSVLNLQYTTSVFPILTRGDLEGRLTPLTAILADSLSRSLKTKGLAALARALAQAERCPSYLCIPPWQGAIS